MPNAIDTLRSWMPPNVGGVSAEGWEALARVEALLQAAERVADEARTRPDYPGQMTLRDDDHAHLVAAVRDVTGEAHGA